MSNVDFTVNLSSDVLKLISTVHTDTYRVEISPGARAGDNWLGVIYRIKITTSDEKTQSLILKMAPHQEDYRILFPIKSLFNREIYMYEKVIPQFLKLQERRNVKMFNPFVTLHRSTRTDRGEFLLMEDLKTAGFENIDHRVAVDYAHASLIMKEFGKFHAFSYALRDQNVDVFTNIGSHTEEDFYNGAMHEPTWTLIQKLGTQILDRLDPVRDMYYYVKFEEFLSKSHGIINNIVRSKWSGHHAVICHGDSEVRNILFKYEDPSRPHVPTQLRFIDWQVSFLGSPAFDISFFMFLCTDKELRDRYYKILIEEYYDSLTSFLKELGSDPNILPFDVLQEHLEKFSVFGFFVAIWATSINLKEASEAASINKTSKSDVIDSFATIKNESYFSRITDVIFDFFDYGYKF